MPRIFKNKNGTLSIVFGKNEQAVDVVLIHDRGPGMAKQTNFFGSKLSRYVFHSANAYGDSGHSTACDTYTKEDGLETEYKLVKKVKK